MRPVVPIGAAAPVAARRPSGGVGGGGVASGWVLIGERCDSGHILCNEIK